ncbi:cell division protein FtsQ/DivIB [Paenibacillus protaetiae]|uniref:Cell division protein DivIB n=1 Tax=Paenibacillus protaetiae TaxID=2509456 RepID=A0A4P6ETP0_9BACL|nr:FtsQ-type POTRA domain-containing protein [Paenibacillus protaetiae]QAY65423.1 FtsQ-type POTRA domain-containing protein [Paenibacillus protaetiae]
MSTTMPVLKEPVKKRKSSRRLLTVLFLLFIVILSVLFFNSSISKISEIKITGAVYASTGDIGQAANIKIGDSFFGTSAHAIENRIEKLSPIESVTVSKKFPGKVNIAVEEHKVVAFELSDQGEMTAILSNGAGVKAAPGESLADRPVLTGWDKDNPVLSQLTKQLSAISPSDLNDLSEIVPFPSKAYPDRIKMYTRTKFEVVTAVSVLQEKIKAINAVIETQEPGKITMLLADTYVPFDVATAENENSSEKDSTQ